MADDVRRFGMIEVEEVGDGVYQLTVDGVLWASIEWSPRQAVWCVEDGVNQCLLHVAHIHGENPDPTEAIWTAKRMIRDGSMPSPQDAMRALLERQQARQQTEEPGEQISVEELGQPIDISTLMDPLFVERE
jgi:hypothetical protein